MDNILPQTHTLEPVPAPKLGTHLAASRRHDSVRTSGSRNENAWHPHVQYTRWITVRPPHPPISNFPSEAVRAHCAPPQSRRRRSSHLALPPVRSLVTNLQISEVSLARSCLHPHSPSAQADSGIRSESRPRSAYSHGLPVATAAESDHARLPRYWNARASRVRHNGTKCQLRASACFMRLASAGDSIAGLLRVCSSSCAPASPLATITRIRTAGTARSRFTAVDDRSIARPVASFPPWHTEVA
jgi:hypothetical protein